MGKSREIQLEEEIFALKEERRILRKELEDCRAALETASRKAELDYLTGVQNRESIIRQIGEHLEWEPDDKGALCFVDLDNFKQINDRFGHSHGDEVLRSVVEKICDYIREGDLVGRFGGDEFLIFLKHRREQEELTGYISGICEGIRADQNCYGLTVSIGIALSPEHGTSFAQLLECADAALYRCKENGKNGICVF